MEPNIKATMNFKPLKKLAEKSPKFFALAQRKAGIQFLNWANNGSGNSSKKPPIRWGVLRGSSSVFRGKFLVAKSPNKVRSGAPEQPTPADGYEGNAVPTTLTWVWNTDYATKMHEHTGEWGEFTQQDGDAGRKWVEEHLDKDRNDLMKMIASEFKTLAGT